MVMKIKGRYIWETFWFWRKSDYLGHVSNRTHFCFLKLEKWFVMADIDEINVTD